MLGVSGPILRISFVWNLNVFHGWNSHAETASLLMHFAAGFQVLRHRQILLKSRSQAGRDFFVRKRSLFKGRVRGVNLTDAVVVGLSVIDASGAFAILCWGVFPKTLRNMWVAVSIINICLPSLAVVWTWEGVFLFTENHSVLLISFCGRTKGETLMFFWVANWWQWLNLGTGQVFFLKWGCASVGWIDWPDTYCVSIDKVMLTFRWCIEVSFRREIRFCAGLSSWASMSPRCEPRKRRS